VLTEAVAVYITLTGPVTLKGAWWINGEAKAGLRAINMPPFRAEPERVAAPAPVEPAGSFKAAAAPTEAEVLWWSNTSVNAPGEVVVQPDQVEVALATMPNMTTRALLLTVVMVVAGTLELLLAGDWIVPGATSMGSDRWYLHFQMPQCSRLRP
jgi:hypothetical protein